MRQPSAHQLSWTFFDDDGRSAEVSFEAHPNVPIEVTSQLLDAFKLLAGKWAFGTRITNKRYATDFLNFLGGFDWALKSKMIYEFQRWSEENLPRTRGKLAVRLACKLVSVLGNEPKSTWATIDVPRIERSGISESGITKSFLDPVDVRKVIDKCRSLVQEMSDRYETASKMLGPDFRAASKEEAVLCENIRALLEAGNGFLPTRVEARRNARSSKALKRGFSIRELKSYLFPAVVDLVPFFVLMVYEAAANPECILRLKIDCIHTNPVDEKRAFLVWKKARASGIQKRDFDNRKPYEPPMLVKRLIRITSRTRAAAASMQREYLFIAAGHSREAIKVPCYSGLHYALEGFLKKYNLPNFDPSDFRRFVANTLLVKHQDAFLVKAVLQHKSLRTTKRYVDRNSVAALSADVIKAGQAKILSKVQVARLTSSESGGERRGKSFETVFGFSCADPMAGVFPGSRKGVACSHFAGCATCSNAVILIDSDIHVARILQAKSALESAEERSVVDSEKMLRFKALYQSTLAIIRNELLPQVPPPVMSRALALTVKLPPIIDLDL